MSDEKKIAYLGFIQAIVSRMANNAFAVKGWSISISTAIIAAGIALQSWQIITLTILPIILFVFLDSYFFIQEKNYRDLFNKKRNQNFDEADQFNLSPPINVYKLSLCERLKWLRERAVYPVYLIQILIVIILAIILIA